MPNSFLQMGNMIPSFREVWKNITFSANAVPEITGFLKKYLKEISREQLGDFLRFCTGMCCALPDNPFIRGLYIRMFIFNKLLFLAWLPHCHLRCLERPLTLKN
jgi:hypothetical protein